MTHQPIHYSCGTVANGAILSRSEEDHPIRVEESTLWTIARWRLLLRESLEMTVHREIFVEKKIRDNALPRSELGMVD
jgi:hypothetical protein